MKNLFVLLAVLFSASVLAQSVAVKVGANQSTTLPISTVMLSASACDAGSSPLSFLWSRVSGPATFSLDAPKELTTSVSNLVAGTYVFKFTATNVSNASASGNITVTVAAAPPTTPNVLPRAISGRDLTIVEPVSFVSLDGSASTDRDGVIEKYLWAKETGPNASITNPTSAKTEVTSLKPGEYRFRLTVTDNAAGTASDTLHVTVRPGTVVPPVDPPTVPGGNYGTPTYTSGYNTVAELDPYGSGQWGSGTLASHLSTDIYFTGPGSFKSVPSSVSAGIRSEVQYPSSLTSTEGVIEYDVRYETIFQNSGHSLQFHPNTSGGSASPGLWHENGKFVWVNWKGGTNTKYVTNFTIPKDKWMHVVLEYKFGAKGYLKFTIDGVVVLNKTDIQVGDGSGQYLKVGVNMWVNQSSVVYYDNLRIYKK